MTPERYFEMNQEQYPNFYQRPVEFPSKVDVGEEFFGKQFSPSSGWPRHPHRRSLRDRLWAITKPVRDAWDLITWQVPRFIGRVRRWAPVLWRDRDWDWSFLAEVIDFKLGRMESAFRGPGAYIDHTRDLRDIAIARRCLRRLIRDDYGNVPLGRTWMEPGAKGAYRLQDAAARDDMRLFAKKLSKMRGWWD